MFYVNIDRGIEISDWPYFFALENQYVEKYRIIPPFFPPSLATAAASRRSTTSRTAFHVISSKISINGSDDSTAITYSAVNLSLATGQNRLNLFISIRDHPPSNSMQRCKECVTTDNSNKLMSEIINRRLLSHVIYWMPSFET